MSDFRADLFHGSQGSEFFCVTDGQVVVSFKPLKLYRGRYISSVLKRTVWRKSDDDFMCRATLSQCKASKRSKRLLYAGGSRQ